MTSPENEYTPKVDDTQLITIHDTQLLPIRVSQPVTAPEDEQQPQDAPLLPPERSDVEVSGESDTSSTRERHGSIRGLGTAALTLAVIASPAAIHWALGHEDVHVPSKISADEAYSIQKDAKSEVNAIKTNLAAGLEYGNVTKATKGEVTTYRYTDTDGLKRLIAQVTIPEEGGSIVINADRNNIRNQIFTTTDAPAGKYKTLEQVVDGLYSGKESGELDELSIKSIKSVSAVGETKPESEVTIHNKLGVDFLQFDGDVNRADKANPTRAVADIIKGNLPHYQQ
jgi:hypothetical protein